MEEMKKNPNQTPMQYVGFWKRLLMYIVDIVILAIPLVYLYNLTVYLGNQFQSGILLVLHWLILFIFIIYMTVRFGGTPGKLLFKTRIVNKDGKYISVSSAFLRAGFLMLNGSVLAIIEVANFYNFDVSAVNQISKYTGLLLIIDVLIIILNKNKRALHDLIAGTYVVARNQNTPNTQTLSEI